METPEENSIKGESVEATPQNHIVKILVKVGVIVVLICAFIFMFMSHTYSYHL